jgi:hypothetical protein
VTGRDARIDGDGRPGAIGRSAGRGPVPRHVVRGVREPLSLWPRRPRRGGGREVSQGRGRECNPAPPNDLSFIHILRRNRIRIVRVVERPHERGGRGRSFPLHRTTVWADLVPHRICACAAPRHAPHVRPLQRQTASASLLYKGKPNDPTTTASAAPAESCKREKQRGARFSLPLEGPGTAPACAVARRAGR